MADTCEKHRENRGLQMKHFLIYTNIHKDKELAATGRIAAYLEARGQKSTVRARGGVSADKGSLWEEAPVFPEDVNCMIVLGGDGTMLQAARDMKKRHIPMIGVNMGTLGYMTEIELACLEEALERLIQGDYEAECRMMLGGRVLFENGSYQEDQALNDIVITRKGSLKIIKFHIYVNGQFLNAYNADGVIITTPTGSTGYNLSAGGPIIEPRAKLIMLTPICPHTLNQRSIILSSDDVILIEIAPGKDGQIQEVEVNFDGGHPISIHTGDRIRIVKSDHVTEIIQLNHVSFLEVLHRKMSES